MGGGISKARVELWDAIKSNRSNDVKIQLNRRSQLVNERYENGYFPLQEAINRGHIETCKVLLECGADVNATENSFHDGILPLFAAVKLNRQEIVSLLLSFGTSVNDRDKIGRTPLMCAARRPPDEGDSTAENSRGCQLISFLLEMDSDIEATDKAGMSVIYHAIECGNEAILKLLIEKGADVNRCDEMGRTPLNFAAHCKAVQFFDCLLSKGVDINSKNKDGQTPLHQCMEQKYSAGATYLIEKGADLKLKNNYDRTPLDYAFTKQDPAVQNALTLLSMSSWLSKFEDNDE